MKKSFGTVIFRLSFCALLLMGLGACRQFNQDIYDLSFNKLQASADKYFSTGDYAKVILITRTLKEADPANKEVRKLHADAIAKDPDASILGSKGILGSNITDRTENPDSNFVYNGLLYVPNRLLDVLDLITLQVGTCLGLGFEVHATEAFALGAQASMTEGVIGFDRRHFGIRNSVEVFVEFLIFDSSSIMEQKAGTNGVFQIVDGSAGLKMPSDSIYQNSRDYWSLGGRAELVIFAARAELHIIEVFDLFAGFLTFDPLNDDLGKSMGVKLTGLEEDFLKHLNDQVKLRD